MKSVSESLKHIEKASFSEKELTPSFIKAPVVSQGTVKPATDSNDHFSHKVALKEIRLDEEEGYSCTTIREISLLRGLKQSNIITLHDIVHTKNMITLGRN